MGFLDNIKSQVGEENFKKAESFLDKKDEPKQEQKSEGESKPEGEQNKPEAETKTDGPAKTEGSRYVDKIEGYIGQEKVNEIKSKVGEDTFKKAENIIEDQINSRFGGKKN